MLGNQVELWETLLAAMKLGAVVIPATTLLHAADLRDRLDRGGGQARDRRRGGHRQVRRRRGRLHAHRGARRAGRLARLRRRRRRRRRVHPGRRHPRLRHAAALLHLRHHGEAEAGGAHPRVLPGRASVHDVLDRAAAGRRAPQHLLPGLGQARLEQRLRAVDRRVLRAGDELRQVRRGRRAGRARPAAGSPASAPRPRCGGCSSRPTCPGCPTRRRKVVGAGRAAQPRGDRAGGEGLGGADPRRVRADRVHRADRQPAGSAGQAGLDGPAHPRLPDRADRPGHRGEGRRGRDLHRPVPPPARADGRLPRRPGAQRRGDGRTASTTPATSAPATPTATSPTSAGPTTCSRPATTGSARSSWRACSSSIPRWPRRPSCPRPTRCGWPCPRPTSCWPPGTSRPSETARSILEFARDNLASVQARPPPGVRRRCPRPSPARSGGWSCAAGRPSCTPTRDDTAGEFTL